MKLKLSSLFIFLSLSIPVVQGQTIIYVNHHATGANTGASWHDAYPTLQDALAVAVAPAEIWVAGGTYKPFEGFSPPPDVRSVSFEVGDGIAVYGGFNGVETLRAERNPAVNPTILSGDLENNDAGLGNEDNSYHVIVTTGGTPILDGLTITAGHADTNGGGAIVATGTALVTNCIIEGNASRADGGAVTASGNPVFTGCTFRGNSAATNGGAITITVGITTISNCVFEANTARAGGAIHFRNATVVLTDSRFDSNQAVTEAGALYGGAIVGALNVSNCEFTNNQAGYVGGGVRVDVSGTGIQFTGCHFSGNTSVNHGGAFYLSGSSAPVGFQGCQFVSNQSGANGGGLAVSGGSATGLVVEDCLFRGNTATLNGGGLWMLLSTATANVMICRDCLFQGDASSQNGGGVFLDTTSTRTPSETFINCTFQGNQATGNGGAVGGATGSSYILGSPNLHNCLIWNNASAGSTNGAAASIGGYLFAGGDHNLIQNIAATGTGSLDGTIAGNDPLFVAPGDPLTAPDATGDARLGVGSPVLDIGDNTTNASPFDASGAPRIANTTIDFGAYEAILGPAIAVRRAGETAELASNTVLELGAFRFEDGPQTFTFEVANDGLAALSGLAVTPSGSAAGSTSLMQPASSLAAYGTTLFEATVTPSAAGPQTLVLSLASNDADKNPFVLTLNFLFASDVADTDGDGLSDYFEWTDNNPGTDPAAADTDHDGVSDGAEIRLGGLGFANGRDDSARLAEIQSDAQNLGLYSETNIGNLALGQPLLTRDPNSGNFSLRTGVLTSPDLATPFVTLTNFTPTFNPTTGEITIEFPAPDTDTSFYRVFGTVP
ncbi:MAG TPA: choice-of-anchor Q domain-containing protein [Verrucomicrobiae bacterium]|nr:choice-of-anchor Q domain-containing protein [Verrucomicrobiae bacterium]